MASEAPRRAGERGPAWRYVVAAVAVAGAFALRMLLARWFGPPYILFYPAVMLTAVVGGLGPGLLATALSAFLAAAYVIPSEGAARGLTPRDLVGLAAFSLMGAFMSGVADRYRRARERVARSEAEAASREALREANARLVEADRRKNEFLGVLSHELRNPLAPIRNSLWVLDRVPPEGEQARRARRVIERQTQMLSRLVDELLDVTRISRGKIALRPQRVDACALLRRTAEDLRSVVEARGAALRVVLPAEPAWVDADPLRLAQVVGNLLHNAGKFARDHGEVVLSLSETGAAIEIRVRDDGVGIGPELLERLFEPFVQAAGSPAHRHGGLGLALAKGLVELHGGTVSAESRGPGQGAELIVRLPPAAPPAPAPAAAAPPPGPPAPRPLDVLLIEDNPDVADTLAEVLRLQGHRVRVAEDGTTGLAAVRASPPDIVLCDLGLPDVDGYEVARAVRADAALAGIRLVAVSGYASPHDVARALDAGFEAHLPKPPPLDRLAELLVAPAIQPARRAGT